MTYRAAFIAALALPWPLAAPAQDATPTIRAEIDIAAAESCIGRNQDENKNPIACLTTQMDACLTVPPEQYASAVLCFAEARSAWESAIAARMSRLRTAGSPAVPGFAVQAKYDVLAGLLQCDRVEELAALGDAPAEAIKRDKARCTALTAAATFARLVLSTRRELPAE